MYLGPKRVEGRDWGSISSSVGAGKSPPTRISSEGVCVGVALTPAGVLYRENKPKNTKKEKKQRYLVPASFGPGSSYLQVYL